MVFSHLISRRIHTAFILFIYTHILLRYFTRTKREMDPHTRETRDGREKRTENRERDRDRDRERTDGQAEADKNNKNLSIYIKY